MVRTRAAASRHSRSNRGPGLWTQASLPAFLAAVMLEREPWKSFFCLALFIGARRGNLLAMRWEELNWDHHLWRIPKTKSGLAVVVHLCPPAVDVLSGRLAARQEDCPWVFPGHGRTGHLQDPRRSWRRVLKRSEVKGLTLHDLRRTFGAWQAMTGGNLLAIAKSLGHRSVAATPIYARLSDRTVEQSVETGVSAMLAAAQPAQIK